MPGTPTRSALTRRGAALGLAMLALGGPAALAATTVDFKVGGGRFGGFSGVAVEGDRGVNRIAVAFEEEANRYTIRDRASRVIGPDECERVNRQALRCEAAFGGELRVRGNDGDDVLRLAGPTQRGGTLVGGAGGDLLRGGGRGDDLDGGGGPDLLSGGLGDDSVDGFGGNDVMRGQGGDDLLGALDEFGRDVFEGGGGDDLVSAVNRDADRRIDCGPGRDQAFVDRQDPRTRRCERVPTIKP